MKVELEVAEDGAVDFHNLPDALKKPFQDEFNRAYGKGSTKAAEEAKGQLEREISELKKGGLNPAEREKLRSAEMDLSRAKEEIALRDKNYEEAKNIREARHAQELKERDDLVTLTKAEIEKRDARIRDLAQSEIGVAALKAGVRDSSVAELRKLLGDRIGLDANLQPYVRDAQDPAKAAVDKDGKPVSVEGLVLEYVTANPHHKAAPGGRGGGERLTGVAAEKAALLDEVAKNPSVDNVARAFARAGVSH